MVKKPGLNRVRRNIVELVVFFFCWPLIDTKPAGKHTNMSLCSSSGSHLVPYSL